MIINTFNENKIKFLVDKVDLENAGILPEKFITNPNTTLSYINKLLKSNTNLYSQITNEKGELVLKDYFIYTYDYKVFSIIISQ